MRSLLLALVATVLMAAPAQGDVTASDITSPADATYSEDDESGGHITVSGTATADDPGSDEIDIHCYFSHDGQADFLGLATATVQNDGSFSADIPLNQLGQQPCRLRAVPSGTLPPDLTAFTGPRIGVLHRHVTTVSGHWTEFTLGLNSLSGFATFQDVAGCGVYNLGALDPATLDSSLVWFCGDALQDREDTATPATRSEVQVDGKNAYFARSSFASSSPADPLPTLTTDTSTGLGSVSSRQTIAFCTPGNGFPADASNCTGFAASGVRLDHSASPLGSGHLVLTSDTFVSVDGQAHDLDLLFDTGANSGSSTWRFPGESAFAPHGTDVVGGFPPGAAVTLVDQSGSSFGLLAWSGPPLGARFNEPGGFEAHYLLHVSPGCSPTLKFAFGAAFTLGEVNAMTPDALDAVAVEPLSPQCTSSPPGPGPPQPTPPAPTPPHVTSAKLGRVKLGHHGSVTVLVKVSDPGTVSAKETALLPRTARKKTKRTTIAKARKSASKAGQVKLVLKPNAKARKLLRARHRLRTRLTVTYRPTSGATTKLARSLKLHR